MYLKYMALQGGARANDKRNEEADTDTLMFVSEVRN